MHPLRILTLATLFPNAAQPNFGIFVERQTASLAAREDVDVTVINPLGIPPWPLSRHARYAELNALPGQEQWRGLSVYRPRFMLIPKIGGRLNPKLIARSVLPLARKLHAKAPFDLVDAEFFYPDGPAAMYIAHALGIPFTIKARGADIHHWSTQAGCREQLTRAAISASGLLAVSEALKADIAALDIDADKIHVHYTGIDRSHFHPGSTANGNDRTSEKAALGLTGPVILSVGALIPRKQQALVIRALPQLPGVTYVIAGQGALEGEYHALAEQLGVADRVRLIGPIAHNDLPKWFRAADIMALVSKSEGLANAWVEALACGTPVIASNVGGAPELIRSPDAGYIVEQTPEAIAAAAQTLLNAPPEPASVAAQVAHMSWAENAAQLEALFRVISSKMESSYG